MLLEMRSRHARYWNEFKEENRKLYTRMILATSDYPDEYPSVASLVVQGNAPIGTEEFGDGRQAVLATPSPGWTVLSACRNYTTSLDL